MKKKLKIDVSIYEYRCRRCQEIFNLTYEEHWGTIIGKMLNLNKSESETIAEKKEFEEEKNQDEILISDKPRLFEIHVCEDGGRGLADLIGCEPSRKVIVSKGEWEGQSREFSESNFTNKRNNPPYSNR